MSSLYELSAELRRAKEMIEDLEEQSDFTAAESVIAEWLSDINRDVMTRVQGIVRWDASAKAEEEALDVEIKALQAKKKTKQNLQKNLRSYLQQFMESQGLRKFDALIRKISIIPGRASFEVDESKIMEWPADMFDAAVQAGAIVYEPKLKSKTALKALPGFETLPGVSEVVGEDSIRIV